MKQIVYCLGATATLVLFVMLIIVVEGKTTRENSLEQTLSFATQDAVVKVSEKENASDQMLINEFEKIFKKMNEPESEMAKDSDFCIEVNVVEADAKKGILSVEATEKFAYPGGRLGQVEANATYVLNQKGGDLN